MSRFTVPDGEWNPAYVFEHENVVIIQCEIQCQIHVTSLSTGASIKGRTNVLVHGKHSLRHKLDTGRLATEECACVLALIFHLMLLTMYNLWTSAALIC